MDFGCGQAEYGLDALGWWARRTAEGGCVDLWTGTLGHRPHSPWERGGGAMGVGTCERGCVKCRDFFLVSFSSDFNQEQMCEGADELETSVTTVRAEV